MVNLDEIELAQLQKLSAAGNLSPGVQVKLDDYIARKSGSPEVAITQASLAPRAPAAIPEIETQVVEPPSVDLYGVTPEPAYGGGVIEKKGAKPAATPAPVPSTASEAELEKAAATGTPIELPDIVATGAPESAPEKPDAASGLGSAYSMQQMGALAEARALGQGFKERADAIGRGIESLDRLEAKNQAAEIERQQRLNDELNKYQTAISDFNKLQVDPDRYWKNAGTGSKILWGLAAFFGGMGKGSNQAVEMLKDTINQDIAAQRMDIEKARVGADAQGTVLNYMYRQFGDMRMAESAARASILDKMKLQGEQIASKYQNPVVQAKAAQFVAQIEQEKQKAQAAFEMQLAKKMAKAKYSGANYDPEFELLDEKDRAAYVNEKVSPDIKVSGIARTPDAATKFKEAAVNTSNALSMLSELRSLKGRSLGPTEKKARAEVLTNMLQGPLRVPIVGPGAVTDAERALIKQVVADPTAIFTTNADVRLATLEKILKNGLRNHAKSEGLNIKLSDIQRN